MIFTLDALMLMMFFKECTHFHLFICSWICTPIPFFPTGEMREKLLFIYLFIFGCEKGDLNVQYSMDEREIRHGKKGQPVGIEPV